MIRVRGKDTRYRRGHIEEREEANVDDVDDDGVDDDVEKSRQLSLALTHTSRGECTGVLVCVGASLCAYDKTRFKHRIPTIIPGVSPESVYKREGEHVCVVI